MESQVYKINIRLSGIRPLLFDRYAGDNDTVLPVEEKMYLTDEGQLMMPAINVFSMLCAENTKSTAKMLWGRKAKTISAGISAFIDITPYDIPIVDENGPIFFTGFNDQIQVVEHVARLKGGIPNPKIRPQLNLPWYLNFIVHYQRNEILTMEMLRQAFMASGAVGLGTFRPFYGRFMVDRFDVE